MNQVMVRTEEKKVEYCGGQARIYYYEYDNKYCARAYRGKKQKCDFHYSYKSEAQRAEACDKWVKQVEELIEYRRVNRESRKNATHDYKVGDVIVYSWGYDQTNVDFYQVVRVPSNKTVVIKQICTEITEDGFMSGKSVARVNDFREGAVEETKRPNERGSVSFSCGWGRKWDGRAQYVSWYA
jgi:hypothetical protein